MTALARWRLERRRAKALGQATHPALKATLSAELPDQSARFEDMRFVCLDFETTGLDHQSDHILSIGSVAIEGGHIQLASARYDVIDFAGTLKEETLAIHGLTHDALATGVPIGEALERLLEDMRGAVMVAHQASIESEFLNAACNKLMGAPCETLWVCTLSLERLRIIRGQPGTSVRLGQSRERYHLPRYKAHHALMDAWAGAELLLAQSAHLRSGGCYLKDLL